MDYRGEDDIRITRRHQAIIPSYRFDCDKMCGNITEWGVDVRRDGGGQQNEYTLDLQVWRPSPTVNDSTGAGQYSLVGNNKFTSISLSGGVAIVTPSPQDYIQFQPGDVLGFYVDSESSFSLADDDGVVVLTSPSSFTSEVVWFASIAPTLATSQTTYSIGSSGELNTSTRAAPVISIRTGENSIIRVTVGENFTLFCICSFTVTFSCPEPSVTTTLPTPPPQPTTDSIETPPPTTQEPQQPTISQETTNSPNNDNSQTQTLSNSEVVTTTGVVPTTSEAVSDQQISSGPNVGLVVGIVAVVIAVIAVTLIVTVVVIAIIILGNKRKPLSTSVPTDTNRAYGVTNQRDMDEICNEEDVYSYPEVVLDNEVKTNSNEAYATTISTEGNVAYYSTNMVVQENEAYVTNIVTETNKACAPRDIVTTENHYIYENEPEDEYY